MSISYRCVAVSVRSRSRSVARCRRVELVTCESSQVRTTEKVGAKHRHGFGGDMQHGICSYSRSYGRSESCHFSHNGVCGCQWRALAMQVGSVCGEQPAAPQSAMVPDAKTRLTKPCVRGRGPHVRVSKWAAQGKCSAFIQQRRAALETAPFDPAAQRCSSWPAARAILLATNPKWAEQRLLPRRGRRTSAWSCALASSAVSSSLDLRSSISSAGGSAGACVPSSTL